MNDLKKSGGDLSVKKGLIIALVAMLVLLAAWHLLLPALGIAIAFTAAAWGIMLASIIFIAVAVLLFYIFSGLGIIIVCALTGIWVVIAIALFPFVFPLLVPLLIIMLFIAFVRRKKE